MECHNFRAFIQELELSLDGFRRQLQERFSKNILPRYCCGVSLRDLVEYDDNTIKFYTVRYFTTVKYSQSHNMLTQIK